ncbi:MAG: peptide deformylase [Planctomycetales bacterium]|nr:peptide deformylase [Planctomycetales bacterium]NIM07812.1 peptide deformylase [Planctomycetales bacterium]NIN07304.1 peptide deformylase [Planctomycetales bacterium]NIN76407.1 peptide deformylase [Planctomycetales bacterium]NIO33605.1 peptide deformylase [Planctomycetales bacterium]
MSSGECRLLERFCERGPIVEIIKYPHPTLRHRSKPIRRVDASLRDIVREMFALMYEAQGVGLAANQVDLPYRLFVANLGGEDRGPDEELVFINPVLSHPKGSAEAEEGCLSIPGVYAPVRRPAQITVSAYNLQGEAILKEMDGLTARVVQHETDHLDGVLFIDRLSETAAADVKDALAEFEAQFSERRSANQIPPDQQIAERLAGIEADYCS